MDAARTPPLTSLEDFLAWEGGQPERWEYLGGDVWLMAGGSVAHNTVAGNLFAALRTAARAAGCRAFQQNMKLSPEGSRDVTYPDVFVTCRAAGDRDQLVRSATVVVEVSSDSTARTDHYWKMQLYGTMPDLRDYLLVRPDVLAVTHHSRPSADAPWTTRLLTRTEDVVALVGVEAALSMSAIYEDVEPMRLGPDRANDQSA